MDAQVLARLQPLPPATRRRLAEALGDGISLDWRTDDVFYGWLLERYRTLGTETVDRELVAGGRNDARRSLIVVVERLAELLRRGRDVDPRDLHVLATDKGTAHLRSIQTSDLQAAVAWIKDLRTTGASVPAATLPDPHLATIARARALLDRLEARFDAAALDGLPGWVAAAEAAYERLDAAAKAGEEQELALAFYRAAVADLPAETRARLAPPDVPAADAQMLHDATNALRDVAGAWDAKERADATYFANRGGEHRRQALDAVNAAEDALDRVESVARDRLATLGTPGAGPDAQPMPEPDPTPPAPATPKADHPTSPTPTPAVEREQEPPPTTPDPDPVATELVDAPSKAADFDYGDVAGIELDPWDDWVGAALDAGRIGLASHLARARSLAGADRPDGASWAAEAIEGALIGMAVGATTDRATDRYAQLREMLATSAGLVEPQTDAGCGLVLTLIAGAARPALVPPYSGHAVLDALPADAAPSGLHGLLTMLKNGARLGLESVGELAPQGEERARARRLQTVLADLRQWREGARQRTLSYAPATALWRDFISEGGEIGECLDVVLSQAPHAAERAVALLARLADEPERMLDDAFSRRRINSRAGAVVGDARERFLGLMSEARERLAAWVRAAAAVRPHADRLERPRAELRAALTTAEAALDTAGPIGQWAARGARLLRATLEDLRAVVEGRERPAPVWDALLDAEIALAPSFSPNGRIGFVVEAGDVGPLREAGAAGLPELDWTQGFERALKAGAVGGARRLLPFVAPELQTDAALRADSRAIEERKTLAERRDMLRERLDDLQTASTGEDPVTADLETALAALETVPIEALPREGVTGAGAVGDFPALARQLTDVERALERARGALGDRLRTRIETLEGRHGQLTECHTLLARGDLGTLAEQLAQVERHGPDRTESARRDPLVALERFTQEVVLAEAPPVEMHAMRLAAAAGERLGPLHFDDLPASEREGAGALVDAWAALKRRAQTDLAQLDGPLQQLMSALGFAEVKIAKQVSWRGGRRFDVRTAPVRQAADCIVPAFGSEAEGAYHVLVAPKGMLERGLQGSDELPDRVIAFATEWLTPKARGDFLRRARGRPAMSAALLDDAALGALAATPGRGLRQFFDLAIPFGAARPYGDKSAATSIEMFFGRDREYGQLFDPQGSCLVYGGRQLGKTALLKQVALRNSGNPDLVVVYRDIYRIGRSERPERIWDEVGRGIAEAKLGSVEANRGDRVPDLLRTWLAQSPARRALILLDEADAFLEAEMNADFSTFMKIKGLMEDTRRRVKFVFAGLHNVQRFVRTPNSPMLHLGAPVNIGPLLGHDRDAARRMLFEPMAAAGVGFAEPTDAHHMLSLVGYYPSLLQTFGKSILERMNRELARGGTVPRKLRRADVAAGFAADEFRDEIKAKFKATLELDPRYELITYAVCHRAEEDRAHGRVAAGGYTVAEIRDLALSWWPQGFAETRSPDTFAALLDEMVGLGVLTDSLERYALRSARIAAMLGGAEYIADQLLRFEGRDLPYQPDPMAGHRPLPSGGYSPLSLRQEQSLVERLESPAPGLTATIAGAAAVASTDGLVAGLRSLAAEREWPAVRELEFRRVEDLRRVASDVRREARAGKPKLILCRGRPPLRAELREIARLRELRDSQSPVRAVFLLDAAGVFEIELAEEGEGTPIRIDVQPWGREAMHFWLARRVEQDMADLRFADAALAASGGYLGALDAVKLPRDARSTPDETVRRLATAAQQTLNAADIGLAAPALIALARSLADWDEGDGIEEQWAETLAQEHDTVAGAACLRTLKRLGVLVEIQRSGSAHWALNAQAGRLVRVT